MKLPISFFSFTMLSIGALFLNSCSKEESPPPNFVVFIADDVSWNDLGCYGNEVVMTPNIDRIASDGIKFTNAYLTASSCSPSRISILTSRYPHNTGAAELHTQPPVDLPGFADVLRENGYYCGQAGKWHAGEYLKSGFDTLHTDIVMNGGEGKWLELIENRPKDKPFFMWLAALDAHRDWGENEFSGTHDPKDIDPPVFLADGELTRIDLAQYYDEIKRFDYYIGEVEETLREQEVLDNTVFIIMADNGRPFPGSKTRVYDRGMRTPFIISWNKGIGEKGTTSESLISVIDLGPTLIELAGIESQPEEFQGRSFAGLLENPQQEFRNYVFSEHNWHDYEAHERMVRTKDYLFVLNSRSQFPNQGPADAVNSPSFKELRELWQEGKLNPAQEEIFIHPREPMELFNCKEDPLQLNNLANDPAYTSIQQKLHAILKQWMEETGDNVPENLTADWYDRMNGGKLDGKAFNLGERGEMPGEATGAIHINKPGPF
jgi:arylsulfatase A-like enzyme